MDVFTLRNRLIGDYSSYISSFASIQDRRLREYVERSLMDGLLWPEPVIQLNPSFEPGGSIDDLVRNEISIPNARKSSARARKPTPPGRH